MPQSAPHSPPAPSRPTAALAAALVVLFLAGGILARLLPLEYGNPEPGYFSSDEIDSVSRALKMGTGDLMPLHFNKPTLYPGAVAAALGAQFAWAKAAFGASAADFERGFFLRPFPFYRAARLVSIVASAAALLLVALALRRRGAVAAAVGCAVLAFAPSSVYYAHVAKEDSLAALAVLAACLLSLAATREGPSPRHRAALLAAAAFAAGLAVSAKYNAFFALLFPLLAAWQIRRDLPLRPAPGPHHTIPAIASILAVPVILAAVAAVGFVLGTPYALLHPAEFVRGTLGSAVASQVAGGYNILSYAGNRGPLFAGGVLWREFGVALPGVILAAVLLWRRRPAVAALMLAPCGVYLAALSLSSQLDYQYAILLTPVAALAAGAAVAEPCPRVRPCLAVAAAACVFAAVPHHAVGAARRTAEYLGGDTRLEAARWLKARGVPGRPLLIATGFYFHYYPALAFDAPTYQRLLDAAKAAGAEGGYFARAREHAAHDPRMLFPADFLDIKTGFRREEGRRVFEPQPFPPDMAAYRGTHSLAIIPQRATDTLAAAAPELAQLNAFLTALTAQPKLAEFAPHPWRTAGPRITIHEAP